MRRVISFLLLPVVFLMSLSKAVLALLMVGSVMLSLASVTVAGVFSALSAVTESLIGPRSVRAQHETRLKGLRADNAALTRRLADTRVTYRGQVRPARAAVKDSSRRIARRLRTASARNVASVFAESLPVIGIGVVIGATAWEISDSCKMMQDLHELDVAFNPETAIDGTEVCGLQVQVPDRAEVWQAMRDSPGEVWKSAQGYMPDLPDFSGTYASVLSSVTGLACTVLPCAQAQVPRQ